MLKHLRYWAAFYVVVSIVLTGCGGGAGVGSGNPGTRTAAVKVSIDWAARSRALSGPSSALSAIITLKGAAQDGSDFTFTVNRPTDPAAQTTSYTSSSQAVVGTWNMVVTFKALPDGAGATVGTAAAQVTLNTDGSIAGTVATVGKVASVTIPAGQTVEVGQTKDLVFTAKDSSGNIVAVTPGSAFYTMVSGTSNLQVVNGAVKGIAPGAATLTVTVDGVVSPSATVTVIATTVAPTYDLTAIGPGGTSEALAVNENGQAAGFTPTFAFFFNGTSALNYSPLITAVAVNDGGTVAGKISAGIGKVHAAIRNGVILTDLGTLPNGSNSAATAIANDGVAVGWSDLPKDFQGNVYTHGFIRTGTFNTDLGTLPGLKNSRATDINDDHLVVGIAENSSSDAHGFLWNNGNLTDLGPVYDGDGVYINKLGQIAFTSKDSNGNLHAILWQNATRIDLGTLPGDDNAGVTGINSSGHVVGYSFKTGSSAKPALFKGGAAISLASQVATFGWTLLKVNGINDHGQIVGEATGSGVNQAVLLTPR